jgi:hypothetical protein
VKHFSLGYPLFEVFLLAEPQGIGRTGVNTSRFLPAIVKQMSAEGAFLRDVEVGIEVDDPVRTGVKALSGTDTFLRVDDDDAVFPLVDSLALAGGDAGSLVTVLADSVHVAYPYLGHCSLHHIDYLLPEVSSIRLWLGVGSPVIANMLVLAGDLAIVATVTSGNVDN